MKVIQKQILNAHMLQSQDEQQQLVARTEALLHLGVLSRMPTQ
jgi:hypothetical protein